jgi:hypothetical protein
MEIANLNSIVFSEYEVQAKLNGIFGKWLHKKGMLVTKTGNEIKSVPHIVQGLKNSACADVEGELYCHSMAFQEINTTVMQGFDTKERIQFFPHSEIEKQYPKDKDHFDKIYSLVLNDGFEGVVLTHKKTREQFKKKPRHDMEAFIVGFKPGTGKNSKTFGSLELETASGQSFRCSMMTQDDRQRLWKSRARSIGKTVTVSYLFLSKRGVPVSSQFVDYRWDEVIKTHGGKREGAGRAKKKASEKRDVRKMVRLTGTESTLIKKAAKAKGIKESDFIRMALLSACSGTET